MAIPKRGAGVPPRGSGGSGGEITVGTTDGTEDNILSPSVKEIYWNTEQFGFTATVDPEDEGRVIIGVPAVFEPKVVFSNTATSSARVSVSDINEPDTFDDGGWANSVHPSINSPAPTFTSTLGRGFGADATLKVVVKHSDNLLDDQTFSCNSNGSTNVNGITSTVSNYAEDGDGSAYKGRLSVSVNLMSYLPYTQSGKFTISLQFTEHKWGSVINLSQTFFYDKNTDTPVISGSPAVNEHVTPSERIIKYLSGIGYYTTGSKFTVEVPSIDNHNNDTSHPSASLAIDPSSFGINPFTTSPWGGDLTSWTGVGLEDTSQGFTYTRDKVIDVANYRHVGDATVGNVVRDTWNAASNKNSNILKVCIDTVVNPSTNTVEYFDEENKRLGYDYASIWDSKAYCVDGDSIMFGGSLYHGSDLPLITKNVLGSLSTTGNLNPYLPDQEVDGTPRFNPNYTPFNNEYSTFIRKFTPPSLTSTYSSFTVNILTNQALEGLLKSGDLKVHIWKSGSVNPSSPNTTYPPTFNPDNLSGSEAGSIWLHGNSNYNFGTFTDGSVQDNSNATCRTKITGSLVEATFGGNDLLGEVLVVVSFKKGVRLDEMAFTFA